MSETIKFVSKMTNKEVLSKVCRQMYEAGLLKQEAKETSKVSLYAGEQHLSDSAMQIHFKDWSYPVFVEANGNIQYDNFHGRWGDISQLHKLQHDYQVADITQVAQECGHEVMDTVYDGNTGETRIRIAVLETV